MYLERGFCGEYDHHVFETLVFRPRHRLMHCRKWQSKPCWEVPEPPKRPTMPWQFAANFKTGYGYSSPYSMNPLRANELEKKRGPYRRDIYRARMDPLRGYVSETVKKPKPGKYRPA